MHTYAGLAAQIPREIQAVLTQVSETEVTVLVDEILKARRLFLFAVGRVFLALQCLGKRLGHLGIEAHVVGAITEKPCEHGDLVLIASGSGESRLPVALGQIAKERSARLGLITSAPTSMLQRLADFTVRLPCPTKHDATTGVASIQSLTTLFDQALHIFGDITALLIQERRGIKNEELWKHHANLE